MSHAFPTEIRREQESHRNRMLPKLLNVSKLGCFWAARRGPRTAWYQSNAILTLTLLICGKPRVDLVNEYVARS
jgi:hypothetical protein